ncbi:hypothetical protein JI735_34275 (plasmid) [Paenibacillus sonchi]|uniref:Uncharacterized protein n=1 Tax=Paenibacillus sonchi TaxID=373687 RepID=A0A974PJ34_9BACL|nr:hypothetical protein [Paenibacillus sonchi]QQZ64508.1 hypothetical protein JI735_34275 [Paenibacillus sonchi]
MNQAAGAAAYEVSLLSAALSAAANGQSLEIQTAVGTVVLPGGMVTAERAAQNAAVVLRISAADAGSLPAEMTAASGGRPVVKLSLSIGGKEISWQKSPAQVQVNIPYQLTVAELLNSDNLTVQYKIRPE